MFAAVLVEAGKLSTPNLGFLVDTGKEISLISVANARVKSAEVQVFVANSTPMKTVDEKKIEHDLRLKHPVAWNFFYLMLTSARNANNELRVCLITPSEVIWN